MRLRGCCILVAMGLLLLAPAAWANEPEKDWSGTGRMGAHRERNPGAERHERGTRDTMRSEGDRGKLPNAQRPTPVIREKPGIRPDLVAKGGVKGPNAESGPGAASAKPMLNPALGAKGLVKAPESDHGGGTKTSLSDKAQINPAMGTKTGFKAPESDHGGGAKTSLSNKAQFNPAMMARAGFKGSAGAANGPDGAAAARIKQSGGGAKMSPLAAKVSAPTQPTVHSAPAKLSPGHQGVARAKAAMSTIPVAKNKGTRTSDDK